MFHAPFGMLLLPVRLLPLVFCLLALSPLGGAYGQSRPAAATGPQDIWATGSPQRKGRVYFRQAFRLTEAPVAATLKVASRSAFAVFANGSAVMRSSGGGEHSIEVTRLVRTGRGVLAMQCDELEAGNALRFSLVLRYASGRAAQVISNGDEKASRQFRSGWELPSFDDRSWPRATLVAAASGAARPVPPPAAPPPSARPAPGMTDFGRIVRVWKSDAEGGGAGESPRPLRPGERMVLASNAPAAADLPLLASAGFSLLQTDSDHLSTPESSPNRWDFSQAEAALRLAARAGFGWSYFPHFAFPPAWFGTQGRYTRIRCLEHGETAEAISPWDPRFAQTVNRGYEAMARSFGKNGPAAIYLAIHGDYGEAGLLTGARTAIPGQREEWQQRFGNAHNHVGWWCGDPLARQSFREAMLRKRRDLEGLNAAWRTTYRAASEIAYPASPKTSSTRHWLDFIEWYRQSVASLVETVILAARKQFPSARLMLPVGFGDEDPRNGCDISLLCKLAARHGVAIRSTHGGYRPVERNQATMLGRIASAARFYGAPLWTEPPSRINAQQQAGRFFEAASLGAEGFFDWADNIRDTREVYYRLGKHLRVQKPSIDVALFYPSTSHLLSPDQGYPPTLERVCSELRDVANYDLLDERMIADGALDGYRVLALAEGVTVEAETLERIRNWVRQGGVLAAYDFGKIETPDHDRAFFTDLFGFAGRLAPAGAAVRFVAANREAIGKRYRVSVGLARQARHLAGDWMEPELADGVWRRWTGSLAEVRAPVVPGKTYALTLRASFPPEAAGKKREVLVNGQKVGDLNLAGENTYRFSLPPAIVGRRELATIAFRCETFSPADVLPGSADKRALGVGVTYLQMDGTGEPPTLADPGPPAGRFETVIDLQKLRAEWAKPYGAGWTVFYPATRRSLPGYYEVLRYLVYHLSDLDPAKRDAPAIDDAWDGLLATVLDDRVLFFNPGVQAVSRTVVLPSELGGASGSTGIAKTIAVEPGELEAVPFGTETQELLLQSEKFTDLAGLKPQAGPSFSPGSGATHLLIPRGGSVSTRFELSAGGTFRVFYRAYRRGAIAKAEVRLNGQLLSGADEKAGPDILETALAGSVTLAPGVHQLEFRPLRGEDLRLDYAILTSDPLVSGYAFGVKTSPSARPMP